MEAERVIKTEKGNIRAYRSYKGRKILCAKVISFIDLH